MSSLADLCGFPVGIVGRPNAHNQIFKGKRERTFGQSFRTYLQYGVDVDSGLVDTGPLFTLAGPASLEHAAPCRPGRFRCRKPLGYIDYKGSRYDRIQRLRSACSGLRRYEQKGLGGWLEVAAGHNMARAQVWRRGYCRCAPSCDDHLTNSRVTLSSRCSDPRTFATLYEGRASSQ